jgi:DNA-binding MarR family transcriptional regulator
MKASTSEAQGSVSPLSTPLSQLLVAFTIEFDNEFERRFSEAGVGRRFGISLVMWSNFMRFVGDGITVAELQEAVGLPGARVLSTLGGMERWGYVYVSPDPAGRPPTEKRDGYGSARGLRQDWFVRPTPAGVTARAIWQPLFGDIEKRWEERFGTDEIRELRRSAGELVGQLDVELPEYLPIVGSANGMIAEIAPRTRRPESSGADAPLPTLLSQVLLAYTLDFERESELSLPLSANFVRVLDEAGLDVRDLPAVAGVSKEATSMAVRYLTKTGLAVVEASLGGGKLIRLTPKGREAQDAASLAHVSVETAWETRFGAGTVRGLRAALQALLDQRDGERARLSLGLQPPADGWRATKPYVEQTNAVIDDPGGKLPHYPMVLHRGGWPDGS